MELTPEQRKMYDKIKHLPPESQQKVLAVVKAQTPAPVVLRLNDGVTAEPVICPLKPPVKKTAAKATKKGVCNA